MRTSEFHEQSLFGHLGPRGRSIGCLVLLFLCTVAFFWKIIFTKEYTLLGHFDNAVQFYPWYQYASYSLRHGFLPLWDPYTYGGHTFIGEMQPGVFYPLNLAMFLFPPNKSGLLYVPVIEGFIIVGHFLAACFMFVLARRLGVSRFGSVISSVCFALGGFVGTRSTGQICLFSGAIWIPLIFYSFINATEAQEVKAKVFHASSAGVFLGTSILAGHHQAPMYIVLALVVFCLFKLSEKRADDKSEKLTLRIAEISILLAICAIVAFAVSAVQLLPTLEYTKHAIRWVNQELYPGKKIPYEWVGVQNLQPRELLAFIFPTLWFGGSDVNPYFGIFPILLATYAIIHFRRSSYMKFFSLLCIIALIYSLGNFSLLHGLSYALVPFLDKARDSSRAFYIVHFSLAVLAGFGIDRTLEAMSKKARALYTQFLKLVNFSVALLMIFIVVAIGVKGWILNRPDYNDNYFLFSGLLLVASAFLVNARRWHLFSKRWTKTATLFLVLFDLSFFNTSAFLLKNKYDGKGNLCPREHYKSSDVIQFLKSQPGYYRVDIRDEALPPNIGDVYGIQTAFGHAASAYEDYWKFLWKDYAPQGRPLSLLNVQYIVSKSPLPNLELVKDGEVKIYKNPHCMPRAWIVHAVEKAADQSHMLDRVLDPSFNPKRSAVTTQISKGFVAGDYGSADDQCQIVNYSSERIGIKTKTAQPGFLVLSEVDYTGWQAYVDGKRAEIYRTDGILRGLLIEPGSHDVTFLYFPSSFKIGLFLTALSLTIFIVLSLSIVRGKGAFDGRWKLC